MEGEANNGEKKVKMTKMTKRVRLWKVRGALWRVRQRMGTRSQMGGWRTLIVTSWMPR